MREIRERGITLIALVITIVVLLILPGITIGAITGDNGIINKTGQAKEDAEIANEKEIIDTSTVEAMGKNKRGNLEEDEFQSAIDKHTDGKVEVTDIGEEFEVYFTETNRYYMVDKDGNIGEAQEVIKDKYPGDITVGKDGEKLDGSEDHPYEIWCIEDLCDFSNGASKKDSEYTNAYVKLMQDIDFNSKRSYVNGKIKTEGEIKNCETKEELQQNLTNIYGIGFIKIEGFQGNFEGGNYKIQGLYINTTTEKSGLFGNNKGNIKNLIIEQCNVKVGPNSGIVCGSNEGIIENVNVWGELEAIATAGGASLTAGICGINQKTGKLIRCDNYATITGKSAGSAGISAVNYGIIEKCKNEGKVWKTGSVVGGIVGRNYNTIEECVNKGNISSNTNYTWDEGGICGINEGTIKNCYNLGSLGTVENVENYIGGIAGNNSMENSKIINCYSIAEMQGSYLGGIVSRNSGSVTNCWYVKKGNYDIQISTSTGTVEESGEKTEIEMKDNSIISILDKTNTEKKWGISSNKNGGYPYLLWEAEE